MRKWMRDRLQRRKKKPEEASDQPAPPPLQPAYFDAEQESDPASGAGHMESEVSEPLRPVSDAPEFQSAHAQSEKESSEAQPATSQPASRGTGQRSRRRRGGRGRGGRGREQAVAQAFAPAAVKGSIPGAPVDGGEEEFSDAGAAEAQRPLPSRIAATPRVPAASAAAPSSPKGVVVLAIGLPGSGKSSWFKRHSVVPLSSDLVRSLLFDDVREQRFQDLVFSNLRSMLKARLIAKRPTNYVDATNLTPQERQHWIKLAKDYQYEVHAVFFDVPLDVCIERHERRDRVVPEDVMRRMAAKLKPPAFEEGFAKITVVRVKKKEAGEP
ncbi:MAG: kinaselike protein [Candidatus Sulfotelmatobacter sp.]|nr:kinaselike protein [Candidatus Sulfotelmatobacter sp.]